MGGVGPMGSEQQSRAAEEEEARKASKAGRNKTGDRTKFLISLQMPCKSRTKPENTCQCLPSPSSPNWNRVQLAVLLTLGPAAALLTKCLCRACLFHMQLHCQTELNCNWGKMICWAIQMRWWHPMQSNNMRNLWNICLSIALPLYYPTSVLSHCPPSGAQGQAPVPSSAQHSEDILNRCVREHDRI